MLISEPDYEMVLENILFENVNIHNHYLIFGMTVYKNFIMRNVEFRNVTANNGATIVRIIGVKDFQIENITLSQVSTIDSTDTKSAIFRINEVHLGTPSDIKISNILYQNSNISMIKYDTVVFTPPVEKRIVFENIEFKD